MLFGLVLLVIAAIVAAVAWDRHQTRKLQETTLARIDAATLAMREAAASTTEHTQAVIASAARIDQELTALRSTATGRIQLLASGADGYLLTAREVLRRRAVMLQLQTKIGEGIAAFRAHITGNRAAPDWTGKAVQLKNAFEQDYREFQRTLEAHTKIVESLPEACKGLDTLVSGDRLVSATEIKSLRETAQTAATALAAEINAARQLAAPR